MDQTLQPKSSKRRQTRRKREEAAWTYNASLSNTALDHHLVATAKLQHTFSTFSLFKQFIAIDSVLIPAQIRAAHPRGNGGRQNDSS